MGYSLGDVAGELADLCSFVLVAVVGVILALARWRQHPAVSSDAREGQPRLDILKRGREGYVATRKQAGWLKSAVFGRSFRLTSSADELRHPEYRPAMR